jgi:hypothetical protein
MGRGIIESGLFRSERYELELRTSDPAAVSEGEAWIRTDIAPEADQLATLRFVSDSSTLDIPIFETGTSASSVSEAWRVRVGGVSGYVPLISPSDAEFQELRFRHDDSTTAVHNAPGLAAYFGVAIDATNSPVTAGEDLTVDYAVENTGDLTDTQDIRLRDVGNTVVDTDADVTLDGGQSTSGTLVWPTTDSDAGTGTIDVLSDDDLASVSVTIDSAIPDSVVDNFEEALYEDKGNTLSDYYGGDLSGWSRQTGTVYEGSYALETPDSTNTFIADDGGNFEVTEGNIFSVQCYTPDSNTDFRPIAWGVQSEVNYGSRSCYEIKMDTGFPAFALFKTESGSSTILTQDVGTSIPTSEWLRIGVDWATDGTLTATLYDSSGSQVTQVSATDTTFTSGGVGYGVGGKSGEHYIDYVRFK